MKITVKKEIDRLMELHERKLQKEKLVEAAKPSNSPLHGEFTWDKTEGWRKNLLSEAQALLAEYIVIITTEEGRKISTRGIVSLRKDRASGGGYRYMVDVMKDDELRADYLEDALEELESFQARYQKLTELAAVFTEIDKVRDKSGRKRKKKVT